MQKSYSPLIEWNKKNLIYVKAIICSPSSAMPVKSLPKGSPSESKFRTKEDLYSLNSPENTHLIPTFSNLVG
jgi:hypothetical protein